MPMQKALAIVGVGIQSALGTPVANPQFSHGITSGGGVTVDMEQEAVKLVEVMQGERR